MNMKKYILSFFILLSTMVFGQRDAGNIFSFKVKFERDIPVAEIEVFYTKYQNMPYNEFEEINYKVNIETNEIELYGSNVWISGNNSYFPIIIFIHSELKEYNKLNNNIEQRLTNTLYYLINENYSFEEEFNKEILFRKFDKFSEYHIKINPNREIEYVRQAPSNLFLNSFIKINKEKN